MKTRTRILTTGIIMVLFYVLSFGEVFAQEVLHISKEVDKTKASPGDLITYTITYSNDGLTAASNVVISDVLPSDNYTYVSSSPRGKLTGNTLVWTKDSIPDLASLGAGSNTIIVTVRAGKPGTGANQSSSGYYIPSTPVNISNYATIKSDFTTTAIPSNIVDTEISQYCSFTLSASSGGIKSATASTFVYLVSIINTSNVYDRYSISAADVTIATAGSGASHNVLDHQILALNGSPLTVTPYLAPGETYFFNLVLTTTSGTTPSNNYHTNYTDITVVSDLCKITQKNTYTTNICSGSCSGESIL